MQELEVLSPSLARLDITRPIGCYELHVKCMPCHGISGAAGSTGSGSVDSGTSQIRRRVAHPNILDVPPKSGGDFH